MAVPHGHWNTTTFVAGLTQRGMIAPFVIAGAVTKDGAADDLVDRECEQGEHQLAEHLGVPADTHRVAAARVLETGVGPLAPGTDPVPDALRPDEAARASWPGSPWCSSWRRGRTLSAGLRASPRGESGSLLHLRALAGMTAPRSPSNVAAQRADWGASFTRVSENAREKVPLKSVPDIERKDRGHFRDMVWLRPCDISERTAPGPDQSFRKPPDAGENPAQIRGFQRGSKL